MLNIPVVVAKVFFGLFAGMLVNYIADVLPLTRSLVRPVCVHCQKKLTWTHYLLDLKCEHCQQSYSIRRWVVLALFAALAFVLEIFPPERFNYWVGMGILVYLAVIFVIDLEYKAILLPTVWAGAALFMILGVILHGFLPTIFGGVIGFLLMFGLHYLGHHFSQWLAKRRDQELSEPALGFGDVNFAGVIGLVLGWPGIVAGLVLAIILGGLFSVIYIVFAMITRRYRLFLAIPYAPFMVLATVYLLFH